MKVFTDRVDPSRRALDPELIDIQGKIKGSYSNYLINQKNYELALRKIEKKNVKLERYQEKFDKHKNRTEYFSLSLGERTRGNPAFTDKEQQYEYARENIGIGKKIGYHENKRNKYDLKSKKAREQLRNLEDQANISKMKSDIHYRNLELGRKEAESYRHEKMKKDAQEIIRLETQIKAIEKASTMQPLGKNKLEHEMKKAKEKLGQTKSKFTYNHGENYDIIAPKLFPNVGAARSTPASS